MAVLLSTTLPSDLVAANAYWRLNGFVDLPNRQMDGSFSVPATALFRAFVSEDAFKGAKSFIAEQEVTFTPTAIGANLAQEAYTALKALSDFSGATDA